MASSTTDPPAEGRLACPVCLGARMVKIRPEAGKPLVLDACRRCGGIWFDAGEVTRLRQARPRVLWAHVALQPDAFRMKCHRCLASYRRNEPACPACGQANELACPVDGTRLRRLAHGGLTLDACPACRGVWFDNVELAEIWNRQVEALARRGAPGTPGKPGTPAALSGDRFLLETLFWAPDLPFYAAASAAHLAAPALQVAGEAAGAAVEATGDLAGGVFAAIADVIASIFEGL